MSCRTQDSWTSLATCVFVKVELFHPLKVSSQTSYYSSYSVYRNCLPVSPPVFTEKIISTIIIVNLKFKYVNIYRTVKSDFYTVQSFYW